MIDIDEIWVFFTGVILGMIAGFSVRLFVATVDEVLTDRIVKAVGKVALAWKCSYLLFISVLVSALIGVVLIRH